MLIRAALSSGTPPQFSAASPAIVRRLLSDGMLQGRRFTIRGISVTRESLLKLMFWLQVIEEEDDERLKFRAPRRG